MVLASAPGKAILFGEHSVVYPSPWMPDAKPHKALAGSISRRSYAEVATDDSDTIQIKSSIGLGATIKVKELLELLDSYNTAFNKQPRDIASLKALHQNDASGLAPVKLVLAMASRGTKGLVVKIGTNKPIEVPAGAHLGSSSSVFAAVAGAALGELGKFDVDEVNNLVYSGDSLILGAPSGIDNTTVTYGGVVVFTKFDATKPGKIEKVKLKRGIELAIVNTHVESKTGDMVAKVRSILGSKPEMMAYLDKVNSLLEQGQDSLKSYDLEKLGKLMNENHEILRRFDLSIPLMDKAREVALKTGAYGAKGTGAMGGGCVIAVAEDAQKIVDAWRARGMDAWTARWGDAEGVRTEKWMP